MSSKGSKAGGKSKGGKMASSKSANTKQVAFADGSTLVRKLGETEEWTFSNNWIGEQKITIDIEESESVVLSHEGEESEESLTLTVPSLESQTLLVKKTSPYTFKFTIDLEPEEVELEDQRKFVEEKTPHINKKVASTTQTISNIPFEAMRTEDLIEVLSSAKGGTFVDPDFPPCDASLYDSVCGEYPYSKAVHWRRPHEFLNGKIELFEAGIEPFDIIKGDLDNGWFLSALVALSENPSLIKRLFINKEFNPAGFYKVRVCKNGEWVVVTVDDYIPCYPNGGPMFTRGNGNELWVMLLEKAYAKVHGHYWTLNDGQVSDALLDLTGCPTLQEDFDADDEDDWEKFKDYDEKGYIITSYNTLDETVEGEDENPSHAYTVIGVHEGEDDLKLVQVRDPFDCVEEDN